MKDGAEYAERDDAVRGDREGAAADDFQRDTDLWKYLAVRVSGRGASRFYELNSDPDPIFFAPI
jgi:hypothetical protein